MSTTIASFHVTIKAKLLTHKLNFPLMQPSSSLLEMTTHAAESARLYLEPLTVKAHLAPYHDLNSDERVSRWSYVSTFITSPLTVSNCHIFQLQFENYANIALEIARQRKI